MSKVLPLRVVGSIGKFVLMVVNREEGQKGRSVKMETFRKGGRTRGMFCREVASSVGPMTVSAPRPSSLRPYPGLA